MSKSFLFSIVFLILCHIPSFFSCFSHQSAQIHLGGFTHALRDNGPTSEPQFYLASFYPLPILSTVFIAFTLSLFFPPFLLLSHFFSILLCQSPSSFPLFFSSYVIFPHFFYCFSHQSAQIHLGGRSGGNRYQNPSFFPLFFSSYVIFPHFFHCFSHQSAQIHLGGRTRGESIPQRQPIATWYITLKKVYPVHLFYHLFSSFLTVSARSAPRPP